MHLFKLSDEQLTQILLSGLNQSSKKHSETKDSDIDFSFDDKFELSYAELIQIIGKARAAGPRLLFSLNNQKLNI
ncbi:hypothetical protein BJD20_12720 [Acinetobacter proteolyticus]|uniref:hypothetical protein n=1 Tax=Acinetobacter proteolyticus TaxID=1776741 RepID=UPI0008631813|nr:hypothetical protein [Acinetobacter proteolyticus]OEY95967.1 hypothetical protein BJD20_12720 [Acinetobacter proteolyticus]